MDPIPFLEDKIGSLSVDDFEIYQIESHLFSTQAKDGKVEFSEEALERGIAVRLFKGHRSSFGCSSDRSPTFLERMLDLSYNSLFILDEGVSLKLP